LGDGSLFVSSNIPVKVGSATNWASVACGSSHTVAVRADGTLWAWGRNDYGQVGDTTGINRRSPAQIGSESNWSTTACGMNHTAAVRTDGTLWAWGRNNFGQLGDGTTNNRNSPAQVGSGTNWVSVACGDNFTLALRTDGTLWAWGRNDTGQLGDGSTTSPRSTPVQIGSATNWTSIASGLSHSLALRADGTLWAWGANSFGQLGDGGTSSRTSPFQIGNATDWVSVSCGSFHNMAVRADHTLWAWGGNSDGHLGDGTRTNRNTPTQIGIGTPWSMAACGEQFTIALRTDGVLWSWGSNTEGALGDASAWVSRPVRVDDTTNWASATAGVKHTLVQRRDGTLWGSGRNLVGQLGTGTTIGRSTFGQVATGTNWVNVAGGHYHSIARHPDGSLWTWGRNFSGQLGDGSTTHRSSPTKVGSANNWSYGDGGVEHSLALRTDGTLWAWGLNSSGQLGDGTNTNRLLPVQISGATSWAALACGENHSVARQVNGTLWAWGSNTAGQVGDGSTINRNSPVQIGSDTDWHSIACGSSCTVALRNDGTLWAWGALGNGSLMNRSSPVQIGSASNWTSVSCGSFHTVALRSDGTLWAWGGNKYGQLGDGTEIDRTEPVQIGTSGTWTSVACGSFHTVAVQSDRSLWVWGLGDDGQMGIRDSTIPGRVWPQRSGQTLSFSAPSSIVVGQPTQLTATTTSGLPVSYTVAGPATLNGTVLTATSQGTVTVTAYQIGDEAWQQTDSVYKSLQVLAPNISVTPTVTPNFASVSANGGTQTVTFTITNTGTSPLDLTGSPKVVITGVNAADFTVTEQPQSPVAPGSGSMTFKVTFAPSGAGARWATMNIASNDPDSGLYALGLQGTGILAEMNVSGNNVTIASGDSIPSTTDHTNFGNVMAAGGSLTRTFVISNHTAVALNLTGAPKVTLSGPDAADFTVTGQPSSPVQEFIPTVFTIRYSPADVGTSSATVSIANDDPDENPYTFSIQGAGVTPEMSVRGNNVEISSGDTTPNSNDHTHYGSVLVTGETRARTFTIRNIGLADLNITGTPKVVVSGAHAADFTVTADLTIASVIPGGAAFFTLTFDPSGTGPRKAGISISNNDPDENPFTFVVEGTGTAPEIAMDATSADFGEVRLAGSPAERRFTISNAGNLPLQLTGTPRVQISGEHAGDFAVKTQPASPVVAGGSTQIEITFAPMAPGLRTATATLTNNDDDENPVIITLQGTGIAPEINLSATNMTFGTVKLLGAPEVRSFTISNLGTAPLNLTGTSKVQITGVDAADFEVITQPASPVAAGESTTFEIRFLPGAAGSLSAVATIASDDLDENQVQISLQGTCITPEMAVTGTGPVISNQDTTPDPMDGTDFGVLLLADEPQVQTFTITNIGSDILHLNGLPLVHITGTHAADFIVTTQPSSSMMPEGGMTTFVVTFNPQGVGTREAVVSIASNDVDENPYTFSLQGRAVTPVMELSGGGQIIEDDDTTPDETDGTDFGAVALMDTQERRAFSITNRGTAVLNLTGEPRVVISGAHAADFKVVPQPASPLAINGFTDFELAFDPSQPGLRQAVVSIATDDPSVETFSFAINGFGRLGALQTQKITLKAPGIVHPGQGPVDLTAYATSGLPVILSVLSGPATLAGGTLTVTGIGTVKVQATQPGGENYLPAPPVTGTIIVKPDPATLTLLDLSQTYDGRPKPVTVLGTSQPVSITYLVNKVHVSTPPVDAGSYAVKAVAGTVTKTGTLVIAKAPLLVIPDDKRKFAGQANPELTAQITGFVGSDTAAVITSQPVLKTTATNTSAGGVYPVTSSGGAAANYIFVHGRGSLIVESFTGSYEALLADDTLLPIGRLGVTVTGTGKNYSVKIELAAEIAPISTSGDLTTNTSSESATGTATITRLGIPYQITFVLTLDGYMQATLKRSSSLFGSASSGRKLSLKPVLYGGGYTSILEPGVPSGGTVPAGAGWATAVVSKRGVVTLTGKLGDGTSFTQALTPDVDQDPGYRLFVRPYLKARTDAFLAGEFALTKHPTVLGRRYLDHSGLTWTKRGLPTDTSHRTSFGPVRVELSMDPWLPPVAGTKSIPAITLDQRLGLISPVFRVAHSDTGSSSNQHLPTLLQLNPGNLVSVTGTLNPTRWKATVNSMNGTFTGSFELMDGMQKRTVPFSGIMRQPLAGHESLIGNGHYLLPPLTGTEKTSGEVLFQKLD
jgi:alpha-tubulin suppressor-like RCC1 family protein/archaellum component FlaG (FlaF/FlaG flagellin family)